MGDDGSGEPGYGRSVSRSALLRALDAVLVVGLAGSAQAQVWVSSGPWREERPWHAVLALLFTVPLLLRRRYPLAVFLVVVAATTLQYEVGAGLAQPWFAILLALYALGAHADDTRSWAGPAYVLAVVLLVDVPRLADGEPVEDIVPAWLVLAGTWAFGRWMRRRRAETAALAARADAAVREREARAAEAVAAERARIARELHDLVAHSMGVIVIQAQGAARSLPHDVDRAQEALAAIESTGRAGMTELRRLLGVLTDAGDRPTGPQPSLEQIPELVADVRRAGLRVELTMTGTAAGVAPSAGLTAYRIVQEALTNVLRHAGPASASVCVARRPDGVEVEVCDNGSGAAVTYGGRGLVGMRERVALFGGTLDAGPVAGGGFRVRALIPLAEGVS